MGYFADAPMLAQRVLSLPLTRTAHIPVLVSFVLAKTPYIWTTFSSYSKVLPASSLLIHPKKATFPPFFWERTWFAALTVLRAEPPGVVVRPAIWKTSSCIPICSGVTSEA